MTKKISLVANATWNIYNFRLHIIHALLQSQKYNVEVIAPIDEYIRYIQNLSEVKHVPIKTLSRKSYNPFRNILLFIEFLMIYRKSKPDLAIHFTIKPNIFGNIAAKAFGIKTICVVTGLGFSFLHKGFINQISRWLYKFSFSMADLVVFENEDDLNLFIDQGLVKENKVRRVNGCGINTNKFRPLPNGVLENEGKFIFAYIGRLLYDKGITEFIDAAEIVKQKYPDSEFWVIGEIDENNPSFVPKRELLKWAEKKTILYKGYTDDIRKYIKHANVVVLPSYREGLPKVLLEAMAMKKPIITTDTAGCKETVDNGENGYLVPIKDSVALSHAMIKCKNLSPEILKAFGNHSRHKVETQFEETIVSEKYLSFISEIIDPV